MPELTDEQKVLRNSTGLLIAEAINRIPASRIGLGILGASVGELVRVAAVDENGTPTSWAHVPPGDIVTNENLLDNWYFGPGVINQRGQTSGSGTGYKTIDRWRTSGYASTLSTLTDDGLTIQNSSNSGAGGIGQYFKTDIPAGTTVTLSVFVSLGADATGVAVRFYDADGGYDQLTASTGMIIDGQFRWGTIKLTRNCIRVQFRGSPFISTLTYKAVKLEFGNSQTLAHKEDGVWVLNELPDPAVELFKCQRYFQMFRNQAFRPTYGQDFRPVMATDEPVLGSFVKDDVTYYTASSEP